MKIDFRSLKDPDSFPLPEATVFKGEELKETRKRMRKWLKKNDYRR